MDATHTEPDDGFPYDGYPSGWYQVGWVDDLEPATVMPLRYFGRELVLVRTGSGDFRLFDAICPHFGANIAYGGTVDGDYLICPFHGWKFNGQGANVAVPYAEDDRPNRGARLARWETAVVGELILAWYSRSGSRPTWEPPVLAEFGSSTHYAAPEFRHMWRNVRMRPQFAAENVIDAAHQVFVHGSRSPSNLTEYSARGAMFHSTQEILIGAGRERTWLTPNGPVLGRIDGESWGLGMQIARNQRTDESVSIHCHTPVDEMHVDERLTVLNQVPQDSPTDQHRELELRRFKFQIYQFERDMTIWEHMQYKDQPLYERSEVRPYRAFRSWASQFYADVGPA